MSVTCYIVQVSSLPLLVFDVALQPREVLVELVLVEYAFLIKPTCNGPARVNTLYIALAHQRGCASYVTHSGEVSMQKVLQLCLLVAGHARGHEHVLVS